VSVVGVTECTPVCLVWISRKQIKILLALYHQDAFEKIFFVCSTVRLTPQGCALRMTRWILLTLNSQYETLAQNWQHLT